MAEYKIVQPGSIFSGARGDIIVTEPGQLVDAAVKAGLITRIDTGKEAEAPQEAQKKSKK
jgi:hypothetical protein